MALGLNWTKSGKEAWAHGKALPGTDYQKGYSKARLSENWC